MDPAGLRRALADGAAAVVAVHMRGVACDIEQICAVAVEFDRPVVEDACAAVGAKSAAPRTARYIAEALDIPLSPNLTPADCLDLVATLHKVLPRVPAHQELSATPDAAVPDRLS